MVTSSPLFHQKAELFPGSTFVIGYDTAVRIINVRGVIPHHSLNFHLLTLFWNSAAGELLQKLQSNDSRNSGNGNKGM